MYLLTTTAIIIGVDLFHIWGWGGGGGEGVDTPSHGRDFFKT